MRKTREILLKIRDAVSDGRMSPENVPLEDIKECVYAELEVNSIAFPAQQYSEIMERFEIIGRSVQPGEVDKDKVQALIDTWILCVDMISPLIYTLINADYWHYKHQKYAGNPEIEGIIKYIDREKKIDPISYEFVKEYEQYPVEVCLDKTCGMSYVPHKGRKMFFPAGWDEEKIRKYYRTILTEQDVRSPHCYQNETYGVRDGDVVVDVGAAEGNFSLDCIDKVSKLYLIEADEEWVEALKQTFWADKEKVQIIQGFLDSFQGGDHVSLDGLFGKEQINYIKMDIEGAETAALAGAARVLGKCQNIRCAICAYHRREDEQDIRDVLEKAGFETGTSRGYICPAWTMEAYVDAEVRRGIVFGKK